MNKQRFVKIVFFSIFPLFMFLALFQHVQYSISLDDQSALTSFNVGSINQGTVKVNNNTYIGLPPMVIPSSIRIFVSESVRVLPSRAFDNY